jgi:putative RNA 2'-phosphotransferase
MKDVALQLSSQGVEGDAKSGALSESTPSNATPLASIDRIVMSWTRIPPHVQETIITLVETTLESDSPSSDQVSKKTSRKFSSNWKPSDNDVRKALLKALRHQPEVFSLPPDADGWVSLNDALQVLDRWFDSKFSFRLEILLRAVHQEKQASRFQIENGHIRASYGHSYEGFQPTSQSVPDLPLLHGTTARIWPLIEFQGILPMGRRFVQLTTDFDYAEKIGQRKGSDSMVLQIRTQDALKAGVTFYQTGTHVWLATAIPSSCLTVWNAQGTQLDDWFDDYSRFEESA